MLLSRQVMRLLAGGEVGIDLKHYFLVCVMCAVSEDKSDEV